MKLRKAKPNAIAKLCSINVAIAGTTVNVMLELKDVKNITQLEIAIYRFLQQATPDTLQKIRELELDAEAQAAVDITLESLNIPKQ